MGGAEKVVLDISKYIDQKKFDCSVVSLNQRTELLSEFEFNSIKTKVLNSKKSLSHFIKIIRDVNQYIKENKIKIIHAHMTHSLIVASFIKVLNPKIKIIYTSHNFNIGSKLREIIVWLLKPFRKYDIVFSKEIVKFFYKKNYIVIPNGIHIQKYNLPKKKSKDFTITTVGRLEYVKNHSFLLDLAHDLKNHFDFKIQIVGAGELEESLKNKSEKLGLINYVNFLGLRNDIPKILSESDCFVLPSFWEGLPIVLLEAAASKVPIISTPVGSIPSLIGDDLGYLSDLSSFKDTLIHIINNQREAKEKSLKLFDFVKKNFSIDSVIKKHEEIYISSIA